MSRTPAAEDCDTPLVWAPPATGPGRRWSLRRTTDGFELLGPDVAPTHIAAAHADRIMVTRRWW